MSAFINQTNNTPMILNPLHPPFNPDSFMHHKGLKIISWNLLRRIGASVYDIAYVIEKEQPDLLLMQEATKDIEQLPNLLGGYYKRFPLPDRIHGVAYWAPFYPLQSQTLTLPRGALIRRVAQLLHFGSFSIANVHLSHGQILNRRQLRSISKALPKHAAILGDFNIIGPDFLPDFTDVGPKEPTHKMIDVLPFRLDRCLVRGMNCVEANILPYQFSDHIPISVTLKLPPYHHK
ncbi:endonuclease/exonuclease/phosphatase family protein [Entomobacter blattae]